MLITWARDLIEKSSTWASTLKKHVTSMSPELEPAIWSRDTSGFLVLTGVNWLQHGSKGRFKPKCALSTYKESPRKWSLVLVYVSIVGHVARLHHRRRRRRAYAPTSNTASHDTHEKISSWVPFSFLIWVWGSAWRPSAAGAPLIWVWGSAWRPSAAGAPLK